jgi:sulfite reductase beta subunit-like hemoprotein
MMRNDAVPAGAAARPLDDPGESVEPAPPAHPETIEAHFPGGHMTPEQYLALDALAEADEAALVIAPDHGMRVRCRAGESARRLALLESGSVAPRAARPVALSEAPGLTPQDDGYWSIFLAVPEGRISDAGPAPLRTALREVIARWRPTPVLTKSRNVVLASIDPESVLDVEAELRARGIELGRNVADILPQA